MLDALWEDAAKLLFETSQRIFSTVGKKAANYVHVRTAAGRYCTSYRTRWCEIKPLGLDHPIDLSEIYVSVHFTTRQHLRLALRPEELEKIFRKRQPLRVLPKEEKLDGMLVAKQTPLLNVLGQPGAGKTTFLRRLGLAALTKEVIFANQSPLPVFLELRNPAFLRNVDLLKALAKEFAICGFPDALNFVMKALKDGVFLVLLDGLDEVPPNKLQAVVREIIDFVDRYPTNRFVTSCRTKFYEGDFHRFTDVVVCDFDEKQIENFITNWFRSSTDKELGTANALRKQLWKADHAATLELAQTPLLLSFICVVYAEHQDIPKHRSSLYRDALDIYLRKWSAHKRVRAGVQEIGMPIDLEVHMLSEIAATNFAEDKVVFTQSELIDQIDSFLKKEVQLKPMPRAEAIMREIQIHQGLFVQRAADAYTFAHLTLQEFLTALFLKDRNLVARVPYERIFDGRWREVFIMLAGIIQADSLLYQMAEASNVLVRRSEKLRTVSQWAEEATMFAGEPSRKASARTLGLFALLTYCLDDSVTLSLDEFALPMFLARLGYGFGDSEVNTAFSGVADFETAFLPLVSRIWALKTNSVPPLSSTTRSRLYPQEEARRRAKASLAVPENLATWVYEDVRNLKQYLQCWELILDCKESALSVTRPGWENVSERFLRSSRV